jgi:hypothetical protein
MQEIIKCESTVDRRPKSARFALVLEGTAGCSKKSKILPFIGI